MVLRPSYCRQGVGDALEVVPLSMAAVATTSLSADSANVTDLKHCRTLCVPGKSDAVEENFIETSAGRTFFSLFCAGRRIRLF